MQFSLKPQSIERCILDVTTCGHTCTKCCASPFKDDDDEGGAFDAIIKDDWSDLSPEAKEAVLALGYTEAMWDNSAKNELIDHKDWKELSHEQKGAAEDLGYSAFTWDHEFLKTAAT